MIIEARHPLKIVHMLFKGTPKMLGMLKGDLKKSTY